MGTIMHKGEMYGGGGSNSNLITLTWAEYDALPAADKADLNKYYYIENLNTGSDLVTQISNPADNQFLMYDSSKGLWVNHAGGLYQYIPLTEDEYNALTTEQKNDPSKLYYVTDVDVVNANIDDTTISTEKVWSSKKVSDEVDTLNSKLVNLPEYTLDTYVTVKVVNSMIHLDVESLSIPSTGSWIALYTLPEGYRPSRQVYAPIMTTSRYYLGVLHINPNGTVSVRSGNNGEAFVGYITCPL